MKDNRVEDGMMFKLEFDPRVIGNKVLPNGEKKTGIGNFIRKMNRMSGSDPMKYS